MSTLSLVQVSCDYNQAPVLEDLTFDVPAGQFTALVGPSGCGKTTLLRTILGLHRPSRGQVLVEGKPVRHGQTRVGYVPQLDLIDWSFPATVEDVLGMAWARTSIGPRLKAEQRQAIVTMLDRLGLSDCGRRPLQQLSGGQQRRVFLGRALLANPTLLLLDEPTSGVDVKTRSDILTLLRDISRQGTTILFTSHELGAVANNAPYTMCLNRRLVAYGPTEAVLTCEILSATFETDLVVQRHNGSLLVGEAADAQTAGRVLVAR